MTYTSPSPLHFGPYSRTFAPLFFVYSGTIFGVRQVGILQKKALDNAGAARYNHANENRFPWIGDSCRNPGEAVFDHIVDHIWRWSTWKQWTQEFRKASETKQKVPETAKKC